MDIEQISKQLEKAASEADADCVNAILDRNIQMSTKVLNHSLRAAVKGCSTSKIHDTILCIEGLINAGANVNSEESGEGKTALMLACEKAYIELVQSILD